MMGSMMVMMNSSKNIVIDRMIEKAQAWIKNGVASGSITWLDHIT